MASNLTAVLFLLALIYAGLLWLAVARTFKRMVKPGCELEQNRVFKVFYGFLWATMALTIALYVTLSTQLFKIDFTKDTKAINFGLIVFYFLPTVFMVLCFSLMYYQLELLMTKSRIAVGSEMRSRERNRKLAVFMRALVFSIMGVFVATQLVMMVLALFDVVSVSLFISQCWIFTLIIMVFLNINQIVNYFRMAGRPYSNEKYYENVKHFGLVLFLWNVGFIVKFGTISAGKSIFTLDYQQETDTISACLFGASDFFSLIIPFYAVVNTKFVKIFSLKAFDPQDDT